MVRSSRRSRVLATIVVALTAASVVATAPARADEVDDLKAKAARLADQIENVQDDMIDLAEDYVVALDEERTLDIELEQSSAEVVTLRSELDDIRAALRDFAVKTYASGGSGGGLGGLLGGSAELDETVVREQYAELALSNGQNASDELEAKVDKLRIAERRLEVRRKRKEELVETITERRGAAEEKEQELLALQQQTDQDLAQALREEQERREARAAAEAVAEFERIKAEAAAKRAANNNNDNNNDNRSSNTPTKKKKKPASNGGRGGGGSSNDDDDDSSGGSGGGGNSGGGGSSNDDDDDSGGNSGGGGSSGGGSSGGGNSGGGGSDDGGGGSSGGGDSGGGGGGSGGNVPPPSAGASGAIAAAKSQLGVPYRFAASSPGVAFDCSGLTKWAWGRAGVRLPHQSRAQYALLPKIPIDQAQPGDLLFFHSPISHVGIYMGNGQIIHAIAGGTPVSITAVRWAKVTGVARP